MFDPHRKYTLDEYWRLVEEFPENKYEYIDGDIRMMTGGSPAHSQLAIRIGGLLDAALHETDCNVYGPDGVVQLTGDRTYCPDISVSCDPADWTRTKAIESPSVVIEVLSPSTEKIDRGEKLSAYQRYPTIQEILFVASRSCLIEQYRRIGTTSWEHHIYASRDDVISLDCIEVTLSVKAIYYKIYLEQEEARLS